VTDPRPARRHHDDAWIECNCGRRHWGAHGAAGLLLARRTPRLEVLLQHRALWSHEGGTWGLPGGALRVGEDPVVGALREAAEEAGVDPAGVAIVTTRVLDHGSWRYTTVVANVSGPQEPRPTDDESLEIRWVDAASVPAMPLLPAFAAAWPELQRLLTE
jgi:8-oxo-dGTP diphosphatase